ncbi:MAG: AMP-dependent synthetase [Frankiales bacterium]|jgi:long-chain acyl-CoA synthetase|nr:AMP-dependent synthetase [Frankiales bacterium]
MTAIQDDRTALDERIAGSTLCLELERTVSEQGGTPAYSDRHGSDGWRTLTWERLREQALDLAAGLVARGMAPGDTAALMASSRIEHVLADLAVLHAGGTPMSIYSTLSPDQVAFIAGHSTPTVAVLEGADQVARWAGALASVDSLRTVVVLDAAAAPDDPRVVSWADLAAEGARYRAAHAEECEQRWRAVEPTQPATILYTSGTTGDPKGVVLTHRNVLFEVATSLQVTGVTAPGLTLSYLPFAHIAERALGMYTPWTQGGHVHLLADPSQLAASLREVRPTRFFGVPRVWEKIMTGVSALLAAETDAAKKAAVAQAMEAGLQYVLAQEAGGQPTAEQVSAYQQADAAVLSVMRALLGLDRVEWAASAAAPMPVDVARFFAGLGLRIYDVYGMTETTGAVTANGPAAFRLGSVGRPLPGLELSLGDDGEILVRGPVQTPGYFRREDATRELFDEDGWLHTGDIGRVDADGFYWVVDRKKELIITSSGKNIAPSNIENLLKESPLVGHALVFGDSRPYVVAVLTLDAEIAPLVAHKAGIAFTDLAELARNEQVLAMVQQGVDAANARLSRPEQVKRFELLPVEWTAESEELTPTLKLKRRVVHTKYQDVLERLYS